MRIAKQASRYRVVSSVTWWLVIRTIYGLRTRAAVTAINHTFALRSLVQPYGIAIQYQLELMQAERTVGSTEMLAAYAFAAPPAVMSPTEVKVPRAARELAVEPSVPRLPVVGAPHGGHVHAAFRCSTMCCARGPLRLKLMSAVAQPNLAVNGWDRVCTVSTHR